MKILVTFACSFFVFFTSAEITPQESAQTLYQKGIKNFQEQKFTEAQEAFRKAFDKDQTNKFILYNWALTEYQLENKGMAIAALRRSLFIDPSFSIAETTLKWALENTPSSSTLSDKAGFESFRESVLIKITMNQALLSFIVLLTITGFLAIRYLGQRHKAIKNETPMPKFPTVAVLLAILLLTSLFISIGKGVDLLSTRATIVTKNVEMRTGPGTENSSLFELLEGAEVILERSQNDWSQVTFPGGFTGWIPNNTLFKTSGRDI